jgi:hypothetical protein
MPTYHTEIVVDKVRQYGDGDFEEDKYYRDDLWIISSSMLFASRYLIYAP